ncbi:MAG: hybrid sensor histidine kinase/response regulator [Pyrinomonadaceae bacterium]|nr:hybrid sensor histidine kinase/response regulator [Pyrinomonadaceae bacterium]
MDTELLQGFLAQAEDHLPTIRSGILVCAQTGNIYGELYTSLRQTTSIKDAASIIGQEDAAKIAAELEEKLEVFASMKIPPTDEQSRGLLVKLTELETIVANLRFNTEDFSIHVTDFLDASFEKLGLSEPPAPVAVDEFEIDEEMLEIFGEEAEELIQSIAANLKILENAPNNREALLDIRRNAHTLKGSAGIVGLKSLSEVAHRVEDLLDYIAENEIEAGERVFEILLVAADCFSTLASGEKSVLVTKKISRLYEDLDALTASFSATELSTQTSTREMSEPPTVEMLDQSSTFSASNDNPTSLTVPEHSLVNRSIVRVSLEKLDDLVKIASGLVVSRSVFEQRLAELEQQIGELHHSTRRLQQSTNKIETDFEADMLAVNSYQSTVGSQQFLNSKSKFQIPNSFDSLELDRYTEFHQTMRELVETTGDTSAINAELDNLRGNLETLFENQHHLIEEMQDKLLHLRMVSFGSLGVRLQRTVRVTADEEEKSAELVIEGENLEIDTQILDSLIEPLLHLLRNAVAHGIESPETRRLLGKPETGKIKVHADDEGTHFILTVSDDGRGISVAALKAKAVQSGIISAAEADAMSEQEAFALIFHVGLTTAEEVSQVSGRGVGMNIVKTAVARQQGAITIASETHQGTTFTIRLPMALAVTRALLVKINEQTFAFPLKFIRHITEISGADLQTAETTQSVQFSAAKYKLRHLTEILGLPSGDLPRNEKIPLLLIETGGRHYAATVDKIIKSEEIVTKPLGNPLREMPEFLGAAILGDGSVVPVLDFTNLFNVKDSSLKSQFSIRDERAQTENQKPPAENRKPFNILIVDDSPSVRHLTSNIIKNAGWTAIIAKDGLEALDVLQDLRDLPDVILTDVEMPRMNGYELLASLKKQANLQTIPVVMITSRANQKHRQKAFDLGASEYLTKPFDDVKLIETIKNMVMN